MVRAIRNRAILLTFAVLAAGLAISLIFSAVQTTTIRGKVYTPHGDLATSGTITAVLSHSASVADANNYGVVAGRYTATIDPNGEAIGLVLVPNDALTPLGTSYTVTFSVQTPRATSWTQVWSVTTLPDPIDIGAVTRLDTPSGLDRMVIRQTHVDRVRNPNALDFLNCTVDPNGNAAEVTCSASDPNVVRGPASSVSGSIATYADTTGKVISDPNILASRLVQAASTFGAANRLILASANDRTTKTIATAPTVDANGRFFIPAQGIGLAVADSNTATGLLITDTVTRPLGNRIAYANSVGTQFLKLRGATGSEFLLLGQMGAANNARFDGTGFSAGVSSTGTGTPRFSVGVPPALGSPVFSTGNEELFLVNDMDRYAAWAPAFAFHSTVNGSRIVVSTTGGLDIKGELRVGEESPVLTGSVNDWVSGYGATVIRVSSDGAYNITGLVPTPENYGSDVNYRARQIVNIINVGAYNITLKHENSGSVNWFRFLCNGSAGGDIILAPNDAAWAYYDANPPETGERESDAWRWRVFKR